jgi:hypothetical protein
MAKEMPGLSALLIAKPKAGSPAEDGEERDPDGEAEDAAASAVLDAVEKKDVDALKDALHSFLEVCYPELDHSSDDADSEQG